MEQETEDIPKDLFFIDKTPTLGSDQKDSEKEPEAEEGEEKPEDTQKREKEGRRERKPIKRKRFEPKKSFLIGRKKISRKKEKDEEELRLEKEIFGDIYNTETEQRSKRSKEQKVESEAKWEDEDDLQLI